MHYHACRLPLFSPFACRLATESTETNLLELTMKRDHLANMALIDEPPEVKKKKM